MSTENDRLLLLKLLGNQQPKPQPKRVTPTLVNKLRARVEAAHENNRIIVSFVKVHGNGYVMAYTRVPPVENKFDNRPEARLAYFDQAYRARNNIVCEG